MDINVLITGCIGLFTSIISAWTSWFFARKKYNTEVDSNYIKNLQEAITTYDSITSHNKTEIEYLMKKNDELEKEVSELRKQLFGLAMNICMNFSCKARQRDFSTIDIMQASSNKTKK